MNAYRAIPVFLLALFACGLAHAAAPAACEMRLAVAVTAAVPNASDLQFLSSLVSDYPNYRLTVRQQEGDSLIVVDLSGPGSAEQCRNVIDAIRKDGRVASVRVEAEDTEVVSMTVPVAKKKQSKVHISCRGIGSVFWAARNPAQAWRVLAPIQPGQEDTCPGP
jgi:hypothetical protein